MKIDYTKMDTSVDAKTKLRSELRVHRTDTAIWVEEKVYKGALCLGTKWVEKSPLKIKR